MWNTIQQKTVNKVQLTLGYNSRPLTKLNSALNQVKVKSISNIEKILEVLERNSFEVDLKRLDESPSTNEASFVTAFQDKAQLLQLRDDLFKFDNQLEVTFLDNTKIF